MLEKMEFKPKTPEKEVNPRDLVFDALEERYGHEGEVTKLDGLSVEHKDEKNPAGSWRFNVRGSNTEPKLRLNVEAKSPELMQKITAEILGMITEIAAKLGKAGEVEGLETIQAADSYNEMEMKKAA